MSEFEYFVVSEGETWKIRIQNQDSAPYDSLEEAIQAALETARGARKCGFSADVFVHRAQGDWVSVCT
jgi:hypothetical protein